jgi:hypothetical protein
MFIVLILYFLFRHFEIYLLAAVILLATLLANSMTWFADTSRAAAKATPLIIKSNTSTSYFLALKQPGKAVY